MDQEHDPFYDDALRLITAVEAPHGLRERISAERERHAVRGLVVRRLKLSGAMAGVAAAMGVVLALVVPAGNSSGPSPQQVAAIAVRGATAPAPAVDPAHPRLLDARVADVSFPVWSDRYPWKPSGRRADRVAGRDTVTVYYDDPKGTRLGYTIVSGAAVPWTSGSRTVTSNGVEVHVSHAGGRVVAEWREHGHSCVISAPDSVPEQRMVFLASHDYAA